MNKTVWIVEAYDEEVGSWYFYSAFSTRSEARNEVAETPSYRKLRVVPFDRRAK